LNTVFRQAGKKHDREEARNHRRYVVSSIRGRATPISYTKNASMKVGAKVCIASKKRRLHAVFRKIRLEWRAQTYGKKHEYPRRKEVSALDGETTNDKSTGVDTLRTKKEEPHNSL